MTAGEVGAWKEKPAPHCHAGELSRMVCRMTRFHMVGDSNNPDYIFVLDGKKNTIPYGRANAFLNFFEEDLYIDPDMEVFYFSVIPGRDPEELREYGTLVATDGLYLSCQLEAPEPDDISPSLNLKIPFAGLVDAALFDDMLLVHVLPSPAEEEDEPEEHRIFAADSTVPLNCLFALLKAVISSEVPRLLHNKSLRVAALAEESISGLPDASGSEGLIVQSRYCPTAEESIAAAFDEGKARHVSGGVMVPVEVPLDQYQLALEAMQRRIDAGEVPGAKAGDSPARFVYKGAFTYRQTFTLAGAGTLESLSVTSDQGVLSSSGTCGITGVILFAACMWNGRSAGEAARITLVSSLRSMGRSTLMHTLSRQLSQAQLTNIFQSQFTPEGAKVVFGGIENPVASMGGQLAQRVNQSSMASTSLGEALGLPSITGKALISGTVVGLVVFGPDVVRALRGRISKLQLLKNSLVGASSMIGAALGQMWIPVPVAGAVAGAVLLGFGVKKGLDRLIDDDSIAMFRIFKEEFIDLSMQPGLTRKDFDALADRTLSSRKIGRILVDMYASADPRARAREVIADAASELLRSKTFVAEKEMMEGFGAAENALSPDSLSLRSAAVLP